MCIAYKIYYALHTRIYAKAFVDLSGGFMSVCKMNLHIYMYTKPRLLMCICIYTCVFMCIVVDTCMYIIYVYGECALHTCTFTYTHTHIRTHYRSTNRWRIFLYNTCNRIFIIRDISRILRVIHKHSPTIC